MLVWYVPLAVRSGVPRGSTRVSVNARTYMDGPGLLDWIGADVYLADYERTPSIPGGTGRGYTDAQPLLAFGRQGVWVPELTAAGFLLLLGEVEE